MLELFCFDSSLVFLHDMSHGDSAHKAQSELRIHSKNQDGNVNNGNTGFTAYQAKSIVSC